MSHLKTELFSAAYDTVEHAAEASPNSNSRHINVLGSWHLTRIHY